MLGNRSASPRREEEGRRMSQAQYTRGGAASPATGGAFDSDLNFISRWSGPLGLLGRVMLAYIFIVEGFGKIAGYAGVADYMQGLWRRRSAAAAGHSDRTWRGSVGALRLEDALGGARAFWLLLADCAVLPLRRRSGDPTSEKCRHGRGLSHSGAARRWRLVAGRLARSRSLAGGRRPGARGRSRRAKRLISAMPGLCR
jgi:hypothetical protein